MKKVLLIVIDALATRVVEPALNAGRLPNFQKLIDAGVFRRRCTSIFPSITPAATCSIATGCYPKEHGIAGAYWYNADEEEVAYYGDDIWAIAEKGFGAFIHDFQIELNQRRLNTPTIFERLFDEGCHPTACLNYMWYRGRVRHDAHTPLLLKLMPGISTSKPMFGPDILCMGDFVTTTLGSDTRLTATGGIRRRFGFQDDATADYLLGLAGAETMPAFTIAYFPDNDFESHKQGPQAAEPILERIDAHLATLFECLGGFEATLDDLAILITGDHSQSDMTSEDPGIDLDELFQEFNVVPAGKSWQSDDDIMACPNMRAAEIYFRRSTADLQRTVIKRLLSHTGVDQVISRDTGKDQAERFHVATADRGHLTFWPSAGASMGEDAYGGKWNWEGDLAAVDASVHGREISFGDYPNAFERIASAFFEHSGDLLATARLGREFCLPRTSVNPAGSHGSLHALDSSAPLLAAGLPEGVTFPLEPRTVDIVPLCLKSLGYRPRREPGESHFAPQR